MHFTETRLQGAFVISLEKKSDDRGFFARSFCAREFEAHGLRPAIMQCNISVSNKQGTLRGLHYQVSPFTETKVMRCTRGAVYDVIVDMRPESPTFLQHVGVELSAENREMLYVPAMFAHGYQALTDQAEVTYAVSEYFAPACERGIRYDDPATGIDWPLPVTVISDKDASWPLISSTE